MHGQLNVRYVLIITGNPMIIWDLYCRREMFKNFGCKCVREKLTWATWT